MKKVQKDAYTDDDFVELHHRSMHWYNCTSDKGLRTAFGINGKTTAFSNGISGNSGRNQDWR